MASGIAAARAELEAALVALAPAHEGLRDLERLNLGTDARTVVVAARERYDRRVVFLNSAVAVLSDLLSDGYPALDVTDVSAAVYADLADQALTVEAAVAQFRALEAAAGLELAVGPPEPKP